VVVGREAEEGALGLQPGDAARPRRDEPDDGLEHLIRGRGIALMETDLAPRHEREHDLAVAVSLYFRERRETECSESANEL
jgi:hypothetical protein